MMDNNKERNKEFIHDLALAEQVMVCVGDARFFVTKKAVLKELKSFPYKKVDYVFQKTSGTSYVSISSMKL